MRTRLVLVLGMHRSGTSVMAAGLQCLGVSLGDRLTGSGPDNPKGFWENGDVLALNERVLAAIGRDWQTPEAIDRTALTAPALAPFAEAGRRILQDQLSRFPDFGLKEPRLCRLLPFWRPIFDALGCAVSVVYAVREPASVARSLAKRNRIPMPCGRALWLAYVRDGLADADPAWPAVVVDHALLMRDPVGQLRRMSAALVRPLDERLAAEFAAAFIDEGLWHERDAAEPGGPVGDVWQWCREASADRMSVGDLRQRASGL
ncbi:MAG: glycosyl transferase family 1 [Acidobacteriota bacterium]|nr:glycosyl transferase family 1 [Acidobacteriota bacterium]